MGMKKRFTAYGMALRTPMMGDALRGREVFHIPSGHDCFVPVIAAGDPFKGELGRTYVNIKRGRTNRPVLAERLRFYPVPETVVKIIDEEPPAAA